MFLEMMNCRELSGIRTKIYHNLVKLFYENMRKQGPKDMIYYGTSVKDMDFILSTPTLDHVSNLKVNPAKVAMNT